MRERSNRTEVVEVVALLKASQLRTAPQAFSLADIERHAGKLIREAQAQAQSILAQARVDAEQLKAVAREEGLAAGLAEGRKAGEEQGRTSGQAAAVAKHTGELTKLIQTLSTTVNEVEAQRLTLLNEGTAGVVRLAVAIARKVTHRLCATDSSTVADVLSEALKLVVGQNDVRVCIHPSQRAVLMEVLPKLKIRWPGLLHVELVADESVQPGGCRILSRHGEIDATLDGMIDRIAVELLPSEPDIAAESVPASGDEEPPATGPGRSAT